MLERRARRQLEFIVCGSLRDLIPDDHVLARIESVLDFAWLHDEVAELYAVGVGRPAIEIETAVRLMLAGCLLGIVRDRRLMRETQVRLAIRWFAGFGMNGRLPVRSFLTRIRQQRGAERFRRIFERTMQDCVAAGIATREVVHIDASLIRAAVSRGGLAVRHVGLIVLGAMFPARLRQRRRYRPILGRCAPCPASKTAPKNPRKMPCECCMAALSTPGIVQSQHQVHFAFNSGANGANEPEEARKWHM